MNNGDKIRALNNKQLAIFLNSIICCEASVCDMCDDVKCMCSKNKKNCNMVDWLNLDNTKIL